MHKLSRDLLHDLLSQVSFLDSNVKLDKLNDVSQTGAALVIVQMVRRITVQYMHVVKLSIA